MTDRIGVLFSAIADWATAKGAAPLNQWPGCWESQGPDDILVAINGHLQPNKDKNGATVPPFSCVLTIGGWPLALLDPRGGVVMDHPYFTEDKLIELFGGEPKISEGGQ